jgi:hypothetical protein
MAVTAESFKLAHPEFTNVDDDLVTLKIADAEMLCPDSVWGDFADMGVCFRVARALALLPPGRDLRLVNKDGSTVYDADLARLTLTVASGGSVVTEKDNGARVFMSRLREAHGGAVDVGILGEKAAQSNDGATVGEVASYHEFGLGVPQRSFVRGWVDENRNEVSSLMRRALEATTTKGVALGRALETVGLVIASKMQERISRGIEPANAPATIKAKGSSKPLIATGQLRSAIAPRVVPR